MKKKPVKRKKVKPMYLYALKIYDGFALSSFCFFKQEAERLRNTYLFPKNIKIIKVKITEV